MCKGLIKGSSPWMSNTKSYFVLMDCMHQAKPICKELIDEKSCNAFAYSSTIELKLKNGKSDIVNVHINGRAFQLESKGRRSMLLEKTCWVVYYYYSKDCHCHAPSSSRLWLKLSPHCAQEKVLNNDQRPLAFWHHLLRPGTHSEPVPASQC